jgi:hypothetical protein
MDFLALRRQNSAHRSPKAAEKGGSTMNRPYGGANKLTPGLCILVAALLFGIATAKADSVLDWNEIAVNTAAANGQNPFAQARTAAIVQLAVFEAVNSIKGDYRPYLGIIVAPRGASVDAAAIEAAYQVLHAYFAASGPATLDPARASSLALIPDGDAKTNGIATGAAAAAAMIALRANDGSSPPQFKIPGPAVPGEYQTSPKSRSGFSDSGLSGATCQSSRRRRAFHLPCAWVLLLRVEIRV